MTEVFDTTDSNTTASYAFRFGTSDKIVHLTQQQLNRIPYLFNLVAHKDNFLPVQNENNEYVLNSPIDYSSFMAILHSITVEQAYVLFNELPEQENILDTLQLFDYLGIDLFSLPLLRYGYLTRLNSTNTESEKKYIEYHRANILETRQTAAEFVIALTKNEYDLTDWRTIDTIFALVKVILYNSNVFSSRFRHHTLTIVKEYCYSLFSKKRKVQLRAIKQIVRRGENNFFHYLYNDNPSLPNNIINAFAWRGVHLSTQEDHTTELPTNSEITILPCRFDFLRRFPWKELAGMFERINQCYSENLKMLFIDILKRFPDAFTSLQNSPESEIELLLLSEDRARQRRLEEPKSARTGRFNTLPKRPKIDKFKHRSGPKAQKHR